MSHRLQVLVPPDLDAQVSKAAQRGRLSKGEWVRRALRQALRRPGKGASEADPLARLAALQAPTGDIGGMLDQIEAGRS